MGFLRRSSGANKTASTKDMKSIEPLGMVLEDVSTLATLGTGTFGRVRLVKITNLDILAKTKPKEYFAMKILKKSEIMRLKQVQHILSEVNLLAKIRHPFIVNMWDYFQDQNICYMILEYIAGGELFSYLRRVIKFEDSMGKFYAQEIVSAFAYLHSLKIAYRDLKPENLLIAENGHVKITDFGFAKIVEDRTWTLCGTPEYLAPEIIQSELGHNACVDWWALGVLIYEMLAGYPPFYDDNPFGIYQKILAAKVDFPRHFDAKPKDLIKRLLMPDRTKRIGCLKRGAADVKNHKWFAKLDWDKMMRCEDKGPYIPNINHAGDTSNFDPYPDSVEPLVMVTDEDNKQHFADYGEYLADRAKIRAAAA